jgi:hypothetical protein
MMLNMKQPYICKLKNAVTLHRYRNIKVHPVTKKELIVEPATFHLDELAVFFQDYEQGKIVFAIIKEVDTPILLYKEDDYVKWKADGGTLEGLQQRFEEVLGKHPELFLQAHMPRTLDSDPHGPGTILSGMLEAVGIKSSPTCSCKKRAVRMNVEGNDWCENNMEEILTWLSEEASKRKLPFVKPVAKLIVKRAIKKSRRLLKKYGST